MDSIAAIDRDVAVATFGSEDAIALGGWPGATTGRSWASRVAFEDDARSGRIPADVRVAMYDPERWRHTPIDEQRAPLDAIAAFGRAAAGHGYVRMITPHPGLVSVEGGPFARDPEETEESAYERSSITEAAASAADIIETQSQRLQRDPDAYRRLVAATAARARSVNPGVRVLSGLATSPGFPATPEMLLDAWASVRDVVDGHYLSLSKARYPEVMAAFLGEVLDRTA
jgi:hypothetical protein